MIYAPTNHLPLPYGLILTLYRRTSPQEVSLRYEVEFKRSADGARISSILIRDLEGGTARSFTAEELSSRALEPGRLAVEYQLERHTDFSLLEDLWLVRAHEEHVQEGGRYFRVLDVLNERTPLPATVRLGVDEDPLADSSGEADGTGVAAFQYLVDRLGFGIRVVGARHTRSGFAGTECYEVTLELAGRRVTTEGALTGHHSTNGITLPAISINEAGQATFLDLTHATAASK